MNEIETLVPSHIILSPGPGKPSDAGVCKGVVMKLGSAIPVLGVCLGHQAIFEVYGGTVSYAPKLMHGKQSKAHIEVNCPLFKGMNDTINVARYHSLIGIKDTLPEELLITASTEDNEIMAVAHKKYPVYGVQFHPESILTENGEKIIRNFLEVSV